MIFLFAMRTPAYFIARTPPFHSTKSNRDEHESPRYGKTSVRPNEAEKGAGHADQAGRRVCPIVRTRACRDPCVLDRHAGADAIRSGRPHGTHARGRTAHSAHAAGTGLRTTGWPGILSHAAHPGSR